MRTTNLFLTAMAIFAVCVLSCCTSKSKTTVQFQQKEYSLKVGEYLNLKYDVTTSDKDLTVSYYRVVSVVSNRQNVVSIDDYGYKYVKVHGLQVGRTEISITIDDGKNQIETSCFVNVKAVELENVTLDKENIQLEMNSSYQLSVSYTPTNLEHPSIVWRSTDESVATVSNSGLVTAHNKGNCNIVVQVISSNTTLQAVCKVEVITPLIESITPESNALTMLLGDRRSIRYTVIPEDANEQEVVIISSDTSIVRVGAGNEIEAVRVGNAEVFLVAEKSNVITEIMVTVSDNITLFIDGKFGGYTNINGVIVGNFYCTITNNCSQTITITNCTIYDYSGSYIICQNTDRQYLVGYDKVSYKGYTYGCNGFKAIVDYLYKDTSYSSVFLQDATTIVF